MFTELAEKLYSLVVRKRHYEFYVNNLKICAIPATNPLFSFPPSQTQVHFAIPGQSPSQKDFSTTQQSMSNLGYSSSTDTDRVYDTRYYNELLNSVPNEYVSPAIILYSMVEQVVANEEKKPLPSEKNQSDKKLPQISNLTQEVAFHFSHVIDQLALDDLDKQVRLFVFIF
jgi:hypothetical protein